MPAAAFSPGDAPLATPIREGEDERAGRWRGAGRLECGIHLDPGAYAEAREAAGG